MGPGHDISFGIGHSGGPPPFGLDDEWFAGLERFSDDFSDLVKTKCVAFVGGVGPSLFLRNTQSISSSPRC